MELKYILIIVACSVFLLLFFIYFAVMVNRRKSEVKQAEELERMYGDKNLAKMEYDCAVYDEETEKLIEARKSGGGQMTIEDVMKAELAAANEEKVFKTVEVEGMEEITGNYKPE